MSSCDAIRVGSRDSQLAMIQTNTIIDALKVKRPDMKFEVVSMKTIGDKILDAALSKIGTKSLFTRELEAALLSGQVDFVVHSLKDLPTTIPDGLIVGSVFKRASPYDAVVMHPKHKNKSLSELSKGSNIGTSALRRQAQLQRKYPHFTFESIRGNLNTRLRKLDDDNKYDAIILAEAGLERMGWQNRITELLKSDCLYSVSQGAMAVECKEGDDKIIELLSSIYDANTALEVIAERTFLKTLEGGCSVPIGVHTELIDNQLTLKGGVFSLDGKEAVLDSVTKTIPPEADGKKAKLTGTSEVYCAIVPGGGLSHSALQAAEDAGNDLAKLFIEAGADRILKTAREITEAEIRKENAEKELKKNEVMKQ